MTLETDKESISDLFVSSFQVSLTYEKERERWGKKRKIDFQYQMLERR